MNQQSQEIVNEVIAQLEPRFKKLEQMLSSLIDSTKILTTRTTALEIEKLDALETPIPRKVANG